MTWTIDLRLSYTDTDAGQSALKDMREKVLDAFDRAKIGADALVDDTILTHRDINICHINTILAFAGLRLVGIEKETQLEFRLDFIDDLDAPYISDEMKEESLKKANYVLFNNGLTLANWHFNNH